MKNPTLKKFLIFQETELSSLKPKKPCYFQEGTYRTEKSNKNSASKKISCLLRCFCNLYSRKALEYSL